MMFLATWAARAPLFTRHAEFAAQREDDFEGTANRSLAYPPIDHSNTFGNRTQGGHRSPGKGAGGVVPGLVSFDQTVI
jgi:hypothetical protein